MTLEATITILEQLRDVYGRGLPIGEYTADLWHKALGRYGPEEVGDAVDVWVANEYRAPAPGDLTELIRAARRAREYENQPRAIEPSTSASPDVFKLARQALTLQRDRRAELGDDEYIRSRGKDPALFYLRDGMILRRMPTSKTNETK